MPDNDVPCCCEQGGGIPHTHRNPPFHTTERNAQIKHEPVPRPTLPTFVDDEPTLLTDEELDELVDGLPKGLK
jgi:hypothetical protein